MLDEKLNSIWSKSVTATLSSVSVDEQGYAIASSQLHLLYMRLNPQAMLMEGSIDQVLTMLDDSKLRDFFLRLTARFSLQWSLAGLSMEDLMRFVYSSANIHYSEHVGQETTNSLLGMENVQQYYTLQECIRIFRGNRWFLIVTLFALVGNGK